MTSPEDSGYVPGPLDELVPGLRKRGDRFAPLPVHPRVVRAVRDDGSTSLVLVSAAPPQNVRAFHAALKPLVEAALLVELARPPSALVDDAARLTSLELFTFYTPGKELEPALTPFGFERADVAHPAASKALALVRSEVQKVDGLAGAEPLCRFTARISQSSAAEAIEARLRGRKDASVFGEQPGLPARALAESAAELGFAGIEPTRAGIETLERVVLQTSPGVLRMIPPLVFQGLCDLIAVAAHATWGTTIEWGVCEPDEQGIAPPPLLRGSRGEDAWHVPVGEHVLRWCVMPLSPGEDVPTLGAWAEHEFT
jgi:hypothetical protein